MEHFKVFQEAQQAIQHVVKAFDFFRTDNFLLSNLLQNIESLLEAQSQKCNSNDKINKSTNETPDEFPVFVSSKKRKLHCDFDENEANDDDSGTLNGNAVKNSDLSEVSLLPKDKSVEDQVFGIDLLLDYILSELPISDLKHCRYVNATWNSSATKILNKKDALNIKFSYNKIAKAFESKDKSRSKTNINLTEFTDFITKTYSYQSPGRIANPFISFTFTSGNLNEPSLKKFLQNSGYGIKQLELELYGNGNRYDDSNHDPSNQYEILRDFKKLLTDYLPNVEILKLGKFPPLWLEEDDSSQLFPESKYNKIKFLPKLKSLYFTSAPPLKIFKDLLRNNSCSIDACASANTNNDDLLNYKENKLVSIGLAGGDDSTLNPILTALIEERNIHLLKSVDLEIQQENVSFFEDFCVCQPRLRFTKLVVRIEGFTRDVEYWSRVSQVLTKILKACSETLKELHIDTMDKCFSLQFPVLPKLKQIRIEMFQGFSKNHIFFPPGLKFSQVFPNLETFESTVGPFDYPNLQWEDVLGASKYDELKSVKHLHFTKELPAEWIEIFGRMWPNLKSVNVRITDDVPRACRALWKLQNLESLGIIISIKDNDETNPYPAFDQSFTGFSRETCLTLFQNSREVDLESLQGLREHSSILDAKSLRRLYLSFHESGPRREGQTFSMISHVTGLFAFKMCPLLKITLRYSAFAINSWNLKLMKNGLSSVLPYVHEDWECSPYDYLLPT